MNLVDTYFACHMTAGQIAVAAHDPSAKNHTRPLFHRAVEAGCPAVFIDLTEMKDQCVNEWPAQLIQRLSPIQVLLCGCSTNGWEFELIARARAMGIRTAMVAELGMASVDCVRISYLNAATAPDHVLVTNELSKETFISKLKTEGATHTVVSICGSTHLESLASTAPARKSRFEVLAEYGVEPSDTSQLLLVPYFSCCDDERFGVLPEVVKSMVSKVIEFTESLRGLLLVIRPHPRCSPEALAAVRQACLGQSHVFLDTERAVDNTSLLLAADLSLSYGSTTCLESITLGTPSAFVIAGWDGLEKFIWEQFAHCSQMPKVRDAEEMAAFFRSCQGQVRAADLCGDADHAEGALERSWAAISSMIHADECPVVA